MKELLEIGLQLTVYGTGLVFIVLAFLWGLMSLLLRLDPGKPIGPTGEVDIPPTAALSPPVGLSSQEKAAVLLAILVHTGRLSVDEKRITHTSEERAMTAPWVIVGRERQLHGRLRRR